MAKVRKGYVVDQVSALDLSNTKGHESVRNITKGTATKYTQKMGQPQTKQFAGNVAGSAASKAVAKKYVTKKRTPRIGKKVAIGAGVGAVAYGGYKLHQRHQARTRTTVGTKPFGRVGKR